MRQLGVTRTLRYFCNCPAKLTGEVRMTHGAVAAGLGSLLFQFAYPRPERIEDIVRRLSLIISAGIAAGTILGVGAAIAADLPAAIETKAPPPIVGTYNWTGCYLGGYVGGARQSREVNAWDPRSTGGTFPPGTFYNPTAIGPTPHSVDIGEFNYDLHRSAIGGGTLGCNWQAAAFPIVLGLEGEGGYMRVSASTVVPYSFVAGSDTTDSTRIGDWHGAFAGRLGIGWDRLLLYLKGGVGFAKITSTVVDTCSAAPCSPALLNATGSSTQPFWIAGAGAEYAVSNDWSVKGEYLVLGMYKAFAVCGIGAGAAAGSTFCAHHNIEGAHTFKLGVNYHFNPYVVAKY
jgi:outer membrane immunogenic protein